MCVWLKYTQTFINHLHSSLFTSAFIRWYFVYIDFSSGVKWVCEFESVESMGAVKKNKAWNFRRVSAGRLICSHVYHWSMWRLTMWSHHICRIIPLIWQQGYNHAFLNWICECAAFNQLQRWWIITSHTRSDFFTLCMMLEWRHTMIETDPKEDTPYPKQSMRLK